MDIYSSVLLVSGAASVLVGFWVWLKEKNHHRQGVADGGAKKRNK